MWHKDCFFRVFSPVSALHWRGPNRPKQRALSAVWSLVIPVLTVCSGNGSLIACSCLSAIFSCPWFRRETHIVVQITPCCSLGQRETHFPWQSLADGLLVRDNACRDSEVIILDIACEDTLDEHVGAQAYGFDVAHSDGWDTWTEAVHSPPRTESSEYRLTAEELKRTQWTQAWKKKTSWGMI